MHRLLSNLLLKRCPHCNIAQPNLAIIGNQIRTTNFSGADIRRWQNYKCSTCGGIVLAAAQEGNPEIIEMYPQPMLVDEAIPAKAATFLSQAIDSISSPAGAVILAASAVDAMLKVKDYKEGNLNSRIKQAAKNHLITKDMAEWAHEIRLDANIQRHADDKEPLPTEQDAKRCVEFALAFAQFLFVLPARVQRGLKDASEKTE